MTEAEWLGSSDPNAFLGDLPMKTKHHLSAAVLIGLSLALVAVVGKLIYIDLTAKPYWISFGGGDSYFGPFLPPSPWTSFAAWTEASVYGLGVWSVVTIGIYLLRRNRVSRTTPTS